MKFYEKLKNNKFMWMILGGIIVSIASVSAAIIVSSNDVSFSSSRTDKTNLHDAIEELYGLSSNECPYGQTCVRCGAGSYADQTNMVCNTCVAGTYSLGGVNSCITCPDGYTSDAEAKAETECYIETTAGKYIAVANDSTQTDCPEGSYCPSAKVYYGSTGNIQSCGENMTSNAGSTSESDCHSMYVTCPDGYTSDGNVTDVSECYIETTAGKYIATANSSTQTNCPSGSYCASTKVYYGNTGGIEACPSYYNKSSASASAITDCYVTTTAGKWIATAYAESQSTCSGGYYCPGANVNYGSTGGRTSCPGSYTSSSGATSSSNCYISTSGGEYIKTAYSSTKSTCPAGSYCPAATINYGNTGDIRSCGSGMTSPSGSSSSSACISDSYTYTKTAAAEISGTWTATYRCYRSTGWAVIESCRFFRSYASDQNATCNGGSDGYSPTFYCTFGAANGGVCLNNACNSSLHGSCIGGPSMPEGESCS